MQRLAANDGDAAEGETATAATWKQVHLTLKKIAKARGALDADEAVALREAERLRLWRRVGCASLLEYMERELGYSPRTAIERLRVARAIEKLPLTARELRDGKLSYSAARELTRVATGETEREWLQACATRNLRELEQMVSGRKPGDRPTDPPDPSLRRKVLRFEVKVETYALLRQAQQILESELGGRLEDDDLIATLARQVIDGQAAARRTAAHQIAVTVCEQCKRGWQDAAGAKIEMSRAAIERAECDAQHIGSLERKRPGRATQTISPATRRLVLRRDHGACSVPGCRSARNLDIHHIVPRREGGKHDSSNLVTLCSGHHRALHDGALTVTGRAPEGLAFVRVAQSALETATLLIDVRKALVDLGFTGAEAKSAVEAAHTHVGTRVLTGEQWIGEALRHCPRPGVTLGPSG